MSLNMDMYLYDFPVEKMLAMSEALDGFVERELSGPEKLSYYLAGKLQNNDNYCIQLISVEYEAPLEEGTVTRGWEKKGGKS